MLYAIFSQKRTESIFLLAFVWFLANVTKLSLHMNDISGSYTGWWGYVLGSALVLVSAYFIRYLLNEYFPSIVAYSAVHYFIGLFFAFVPTTLTLPYSLMILMYVWVLLQCVQWFYREKNHFQIFNASVLVFFACLINPSAILWYLILFFAIIIFTQAKVNYFIIVLIGFLISYFIQNTLFLFVPADFQHLRFQINDINQILDVSSAKKSWLQVLFQILLLLIMLFEWAKSVTRGNVLKRKFMLLLGFALLFDVMMMLLSSLWSPLFFFSFFLAALMLSSFISHLKKKRYQEWTTWLLSLLIFGMIIFGV